MESEAGVRGVTVSCSALKISHRDVFLTASFEEVNVKVHFLYMRVDEHILLALNQRQNHPIKVDMLGGQLAILEAPLNIENDAEG